MRKNIASQIISAQLIAKADGSDVTTGATTVYITGDGGTQGSGGGTVTHEGNGCWSYAPTQAETNYAHISFTFVNTLAVSTTVNVYTVGQDFTAAQLDTNVVRISGGNTAADNAESYFDGSPYNASNVTIGHASEVDNPVSVGGYATTTAAPLQPTVPGRTINIELSGEVTQVAAVGSPVEVGTLTPSLLLDIRNTQFISADTLNSPVVGTDTLELGATNPGLNDGAITGCIFVLRDSNKEVKAIRRISAYEYATNKITVDVPWGTIVPIDTDYYEIIPFSPTLDENVNGLSARELLRLISSSLSGKSSGAQAGVGTIVFRDPLDTKDVITADFDASGNRTSITLDTD